jgi:hypothetical protein
MSIYYSYVLGDDGLVGVLLRRVGVRAVNHNLLGNLALH